MTMKGRCSCSGCVANRAAYAGERPNWAFSSSQTEKPVNEADLPNHVALR